MKSFRKFMKAILGSVKEILGFIIIYAAVIFCALLLFGFLHHDLNFSFERAVITIFLGSFAVAVLWTVISPIYHESRTLTDFFKNLSFNALGVIFTIGGLWLVFKVAITALVIVCLPLLLVPHEVWTVMWLIIILFGVWLLLFDKRGEDPSNTLYYTRRIFVNDLLISSMQKDLKKKEDECKDIQREIDDLKYERGRIYTGSSGLSDSEREYNIQRRNDLDREIYAKESELYYKKSDLEQYRREVETKQRELEEQQRESKNNRHKP